MSAIDTKYAYDVVAEMMPRMGVAGVDVDSQAYKDILSEHGKKRAHGEFSRNQVDKQVRHILGIIGRYGFGAFEGGAQR